MNYGLGWNPDQEARHATAIVALNRPLCAASEAVLPANVDPRGVLSINNQGPFNSCEGNARAKVAEGLNWIKTGQVIKLSSRLAYLTSKIIDCSLEGPDQGATISGGALASQRFGETEEANCPYWDFENGATYDRELPPAALSLALEHRLGAIAPLRGHSDWIRGIGLGFGFVLFGITWTDRLRASNGLWARLRDLGGETLGGHALAGMGYVERGGEKWPIVFNSHSRKWGDQGTALMSPEVCDWICANSPFPPLLLSDLPVFSTQRPFASFTGVIPSKGILPRLAV